MSSSAFLKVDFTPNQDQVPGRGFRRTPSRYPQASELMRRALLANEISSRGDRNPR